MNQIFNIVQGIRYLNLRENCHEGKKIFLRNILSRLNVFPKDFDRDQNTNRCTLKGGELILLYIFVSIIFGSSIF